MITPAIRAKILATNLKCFLRGSSLRGLTVIFFILFILFFVFHEKQGVAKTE